MLAEIATAGAAAGLAAGAYAYAAMWPTSQLFGTTILAGANPQQIALTYDDGPNDPCTGHLLDVLARHEVCATFFLIGRFVRQRPDIVRAIRSAGHLIGNHSMTHPVLLFTSPGKVREELSACNSALEDTLGEPVHFFRPPHGARRPDVLRTARELGLTPVLWNAMGYDWKPENSSQKIAAHLERDIRRNRARAQGSNLLLHDGGHLGMGQDRSRSVAATADLLERFHSQGMQFVTVDAWN